MGVDEKSTVYTLLKLWKASLLVLIKFQKHHATSKHPYLPNFQFYHDYRKL